MRDRQRYRKGRRHEEREKKHWEKKFVFGKKLFLVFGEKFVEMTTHVTFKKRKREREGEGEREREREMTLFDIKLSLNLR